jgi:catechol 2,3-dioxygenase-like lactoylglutathione lyase family enzyme
MEKIRYLALISDQPDQLKSFYTGYFGMTELGTSLEGDVSLTDGYFNLTIFKRRLGLREFEPRTHIGLNHLGLNVDSIDEVKKRYLDFNPNGIIVDEPGGVHYGQVRIHDPELMPISLSETGFGISQAEDRMPRCLHVALNAFYPSNVLDFYQQVFGLRPLTRANAHRVKVGRPNRFMGDGTVNLAIHAFYTDYAGHEGCYGMNHIGFMVPDWKAITEEIGKKYHAAPRPANRPYEDSRVEDPDGNKIDIGQTKGWEVDDGVWVSVAA